ncbi:MAG: EamA family transporter [Solirubrobacteraceae bacterium]
MAITDGRTEPCTGAGGAEPAVAVAGPLTRVPSPALVVAAIASVQLGGALAVHLFASVGPGGAVLLRLAFASLVLAAVSRPRRAGLDRRRLALSATFGAVLVGMNLCFYMSIHRIPLGIAVSLEFIGPLVVAVAGSRRRIDLAWVALAIAGILALTHGGGRIGGLGVAFALAAGALWGCYILVSARIGRAFATGAGLSVAMCFAAVLALPAGLSAGGAHLLRPGTLALGATIGVLSSAIPYSFELEALRRIQPAVFGVLMSLEPAVAALMGLIVLGQGLSARAVAGIALVMAASGGASRRARSPQGPADV